VSVGKNQRTTIGEDHELNVGKNQTTTVGENQKLTISKDRNTAITGNDSLNVDEKVSIVSGRKIHIDAKDEILLTVGSSSIKITGSEIQILSGIDKLNC
jgi:type VI secretion system secreted protein VgrG